MKSLLLFFILILTSVGTALALDLKAPPMTPLAKDGIHDPTVETIHVLQDPKQSMKDFPKDRRGEVNWVEALNQGVINPRTTNTGHPEDGAPMKTLDLDILMTDTAQMPNVRFPHLAHTRWLACSNCHPDIFLPKKNGNPVTMEKVLRGRSVAVVMTRCRLHSGPVSAATVFHTKIRRRPGGKRGRQFYQ